MTVFQAFILGLIQGLGEFLPISSSAHLILAPWLFGWPDPGLTFDVALHIGTLLAVVAYFWRDWVDLILNGLFRGTSTNSGRMFWSLILASIPGGVVGFLFEKKAETVFRHPLLIAITLILIGVVLLTADRWGLKNRDEESLSIGQSFLIGLAQALAIIPGVSRSGITISAGLFLGLKREDAARFSFLLSTPIIAGAGLLKLRHLTLAAILQAPFLVGFLTSAIVGFLVIGFLLRWVRRSDFAPFAVYRFLLGAFVIVLFFLRG